MSGTIARQWAAFRERVLSPDAGPVQVQETRRAFYAGAEAFFRCILDAASDAGEEATDGDVERVEVLRQELLAFARDVSEGRA